MQKRPTILGICGSTRTTSSNLNLVKQIGVLGNAKFDLVIYDQLLQIAAFNPDDVDNVPVSVIHFREAMRGADAVLICTPEYAGGAPGVLKNALDWSVSGMDFSKKPVALITASLAGKFTHHSLLGTLLTIEARITGSSQLLISMIRSKINMDGNITDETTRQGVLALIDSLYAMIQDPEHQEYLVAPVLM